MSSSKGNYNVVLKTNAGRYGSKVTFADGFLKVINSSGGTGVIVEGFDLWKWDGLMMKKVLSDIPISSKYTNMNGYTMHEEMAKVNGPLAKFEYTLTSKEGLQFPGSLIYTSMKEHRLYTWDSDTSSFKITELPKETLDQSNEEQVAAAYFQALKDKDNSMINALSRFRRNMNEELPAYVQYFSTNPSMVVIKASPGSYIIGPPESETISSLDLSKIDGKYYVVDIVSYP